MCRNFWFLICRGKNEIRRSPQKKLFFRNSKNDRCGTSKNVCEAGILQFACDTLIAKDVIWTRESFWKIHFFAGCAWLAESVWLGFRKPPIDVTQQQALQLQEQRKPSPYSKKFVFVIGSAGLIFGNLLRGAKAISLALKGWVCGVGGDLLTSWELYWEGTVTRSSKRWRALRWRKGLPQWLVSLEIGCLSKHTCGYQVGKSSRASCLSPQATRSTILCWRPWQPSNTNIVMWSNQSRKTTKFC